MGGIHNIARVWLVVLAGLIGCRQAAAQIVYPEPPAAGHYVVDEAGLLSQAEAAEIDSAAAAVMAGAGRPVMVVTIPSLARMGADPAGGVEPYATALFNRWRIGSERDNVGVLLLVSKDDRRSRIELGGGWPDAQNVVTDRIMSGDIVPQMRQGRYAAGLLAGVKRLGEMTRAVPVESATAQPGSIAPPAGGLAPNSPLYSPPQQNFFGPALGCVGFGAVVMVIGVAGLIVLVRRSTGAARVGRRHRYGGGWGAAGLGGWDSGGGWSGGGDSGGGSGFSGGGGGDSGGSSHGGGSTGGW
jgi:uncharacterized protein